MTSYNFSRICSLVLIFDIITHSVLVKGSYPDQRLPQHETLHPIGLKSARIEIPHEYENSFTVITFKLILLCKKVPTVGDFNSR